MNRELILGVHISAGFVALFLLPAALLAQKGGRGHRRWGFIGASAGALVAITALGLVVFGGAPVLLAPLAWFALYLFFSGLRALHRKQAAEPAHWVDVALASFSALVGLGTIWLGAVQVGFVLALLGGGGVLLAAADLRFLGRRFGTQPHLWLFRHLTRMTAAFAATLSAFSYVHLTMAPVWLRLGGPITLGVVLIGVVRWRIKRRLPPRAIGWWPDWVEPGPPFR